VEPSLLESVAIMLLIPTGITAVVALAVLGPAWFAHSREKTGSELEVVR